MKILIEHGMPFQLAHGGFQIQIEQTKRGLEEAGAEVEWLRWWDDTQKGDLIQAFAPITMAVPHFARQKGIPVVLMSLLSGMCDENPWRLKFRAIRDRILKNTPGIRGTFQSLPEAVMHVCTHNLVNIRAEGRVMEDVFGVSTEKISVVRGGLSEQFLTATPSTREKDYLICPATITERKNSVELAELAKLAEVPILFVGKPYHTGSPYWQQFQQLIDDRWVIYREHVQNVTELIGLLRGARGFVIKSAIETWCFSAHEAAACGLPLLLPDQKWAHELFADQANYFSSSRAENAAILRAFYEQAATASAPRVRHSSWKEVGQDHLAIYRRLLGTSRQFPNL